MKREWIRPELAASATPKQQVALARIAEEAAEIVKEAMKALRFGAQHRYPEDGPTNAEKIVGEFDDLRNAMLDAALIDRPEIICLCGSSRFIEHFAIFSWELEKGGKIVLSLHLLPASYPGPLASDHQAEAEGVAAQMDELHLRKIDMSDRVIVMNVGGYVGDSTRREIAYAHKHGKPVSYLEPEHVEAEL